MRDSDAKGVAVTKNDYVMANLVIEVTEVNEKDERGFLSELFFRSSSPPS